MLGAALTLGGQDRALVTVPIGSPLLGTRCLTCPSQLHQGHPYFLRSSLSWSVQAWGIVCLLP